MKFSFVEHRMVRFGDGFEVRVAGMRTCPVLMVEGLDVRDEGGWVSAGGRP
jgi:hypothetical protein